MIGQAAPSWKSPAYLKGEETTVAGEDFAGQWYVLYSYPLDFTFICPTEIRGFESLSAAFAEEGVALVGLSTDSFHCHNAWFADEETFAQGVSHPVLADTNHSVSRAFGLLKEDEGITYRGTVIVDPTGVVRSIAINDLDAGRSPAEVLRTVQALQSGGLCPANWNKGEQFVG
jgi:peroxiredoxin (alkyl hydroperoxide reductase subunit C)